MAPIIYSQTRSMARWLPHQFQPNTAWEQCNTLECWFSCEMRSIHFLITNLHEILYNKLGFNVRHGSKCGRTHIFSRDTIWFYYSQFIIYNENDMCIIDSNNSTYASVPFLPANMVFYSAGSPRSCAPIVRSSESCRCPGYCIYKQQRR